MVKLSPAIGRQVPSLYNATYWRKDKRIKKDCEENIEIYSRELSLIYFNYDHRHIIISKAVNCLYNKSLTIRAQQIRNKNSYN